MSTSSAPSQSYRFAEFTLDYHRGTLRMGDRDVTLRPKSLAVLKVLVENHGRLVEKEALFRQVWKDAVVTDDSLAQCIAEIRRTLGDGDKALVRTVPRRGYLFDAPVELVGTGGEVSSSVTERPHRVPVLLAIFAVAAVVFWLFAQPPSVRSPAERSVAVLPFENRSSDAGDVYLVDGMHDDILSSLARIGSLKVISRTSVEQFAHTNKTAIEIGEELGVSAILEGGVQRSGNRIRVNVQLIDAKTDSHLWVDQYDRELTAANVFAIQSEIADSVAIALDTVLTVEEQSRVSSPPTSDLEAYREYLLGTRLLRRRTSASIEAAVRHFREAVRIDEDFALAHAGLADAYQLLVSASSTPAQEVLPQALAAARQAIGLDPALGEAYASLAMVHLEANRHGVEFDTAEDPETLFQQALQLSPNYATAYQWYGEYLLDTEGVESALPQYQRALAIDPLSPILHHLVGRAFERMGRFAEAETYLRKAIDIDPGFARAYQGLAAVYFVGLGRLADAAQAAHKAVSLNSSNTSNVALLANIYVHLGDDANAHRWVDETTRLAPESLYASQLRTTLHLFQGDFDAATAEARRALKHPRRFFSQIRVLGDAYLSEGNVEAALELYERELPACLAGDAESIDVRDLWTVIDCALVLQRANQPRAANLMLSRTRNLIDAESLERDHELHLLLASVQVLSGEEEAALDSLRRAFDRGWRRFGFYYFRHSPIYDGLRARPEFQSLAAEFEADRVAQLSELRLATASKH